MPVELPTSTTQAAPMKLPSEDLLRIAQQILVMTADGKMTLDQIMKDVASLLPLLDLQTPATDEDRSLILTLTEFLRSNFKVLSQVERNQEAEISERAKQRQQMAALSSEVTAMKSELQTLTESLGQVTRAMARLTEETTKLSVVNRNVLSMFPDA